MKNIKKTLCLVLSVLLMISAMSVGFSCFAAQTVKKTMTQYTEKNLTFEKPEDEEYKCSVTNNENKYLSVDANNEGAHYWLFVRAKKATEKKKPVITVYKEKDGKKTVIKKYQITVNPAHKLKMSNLKINKGVEKTFEIRNPYYKYYDLKYNKKIINIKQQLYDGSKEYHMLIGLKNGKTTVKAYLHNTKKLIGTFTVTVCDIKPTVKKSYQEKTIYFNKHMDALYMNGGSLDLQKAIANYHANSTYTVKISNTAVAGSKSYKYDGYYTKINSKFALVYGKKPGNVTLTVYEKRGNAKKKKIGTIKLTIKKCQDARVMKTNISNDNDGLFYEFFVTPGEVIDLRKIVDRRYLNTYYSHFDENEYTFSVTSKYPDTVSIDENGNCVCKANGANEVTFTVTFNDGSKVSYTGSFDIVDEDFFY